MKLKLTLDRFEGGFGVCFDENDVQYDIPRASLGSLDEGDIFLISHANGVFSDAEHLKDETEAKREKIRARLNKLFEKSKTEDRS